MTLKQSPLEALEVDTGVRPQMPPIPHATDKHRVAGKHLAMIHQSHLRDLGQIGTLLKQVEQGHGSADDLQNQLDQLQLVQNMRTFGTLCGRECQILTFHHNAEEFQLFPILEASGNTALIAVVARLREEHVVVHELIERLSQSAERLASTPTAELMADTKAIFEQLLRVVKSHFGYEETELREALGLYAAF